jgi:predicted helicase
LRETRGVYYTPEPVVSYIVRSVDKILQNDFGLPKGLADSSKIKIASSRSGDNASRSEHESVQTETHRVLILDPAAGTGTFLFNVIKQVAKRFENNKGMWDGYVSEHLLPRIFGFELLVAPYAVAHLKLGLLLEETGYKFQSDERLRIYLTNTLEEIDRLSQVGGLTQWLTEEADAAGQVKQEAPVMVVLGNPPYSGHSANTGEWIKKLLHGIDTHTGKSTGNYFEVDGNPLGERNPKWLNDDYVKFIRFAQWRIEQTGYGILAFVTNHGYLDNPTFRGMRQSLMETFDEIYILDLHGNSKKKERALDGSKDENVFDIQQGVAIGIFVKKQSVNSPNGDAKSLGRVHHQDLYGHREIVSEPDFFDDDPVREIVGGKYHWLSQNDTSTTDWQELKPNSPSYFFIPQDETLRLEYEGGWKINEMMPENSMGVTSGDDQKFVHFADEEFEENQLEFVREVAYRPFDIRYLYYNSDVLARSRRNFMKNFIGRRNLALCALRRPRNEIVGNFLVTDTITDKCVISTLDNAQIFPLYLYPDDTHTLFDDGELVREPNFSEGFIKDLSLKLNLEFSDGEFSFREAVISPEVFSPKDIFHYAYAIFHSPSYRVRYAEFLKIDFPRLPLTSSQGLFFALGNLGSQLVSLHLLEKDIETDVTFPEKGSNEIEFAPKYKDGKVWINKKQYFEGIPVNAWEFQIGGYRVADKWLKDRKGRNLTFDDMDHYAKVIAALSRTIDLMREIDEVIEHFDGFPLA